jgi:hypothetical protein
MPKALDQDTHRRINLSEYPGTRQLCFECEEPTGRCEEDTLKIDGYGPLCEECFAVANPEK